MPADYPFLRLQTNKLFSSFQNKSLSDSADPALALQGIGWLTRKAIGLATITLSIKEHEDDAKLTHIDIQQTATGGLKGTSENRTLDNTWREHSDWLFGKVRGRTRWLSSLSELPDPNDEFLKSDWEAGTTEWVFAYVESLDAGWTASQTWGFQVVNGERRYARNVVVLKGQERAEVRMIYDYVSA